MADLSQRLDAVEAAQLRLIRKAQRAIRIAVARIGEIEGEKDRVLPGIREGVTTATRQLAEARRSLEGTVSAHLERTAKVVPIEEARARDIARG